MNATEKTSRYSITYLPGEFFPWAVTYLRDDNYVTCERTNSPRFDSREKAEAHIKEMESFNGQE